MFNIRDFSSHINRTGTVQTNKFYVEIASPNIFAPSEIQRTIKYRASSVRIPGVNLDVLNSYRYGVGPNEKFPTNVNFQDVSISFIDTGNIDLWKYFYSWMNGIFDYTGSSGGSQPSYKTEYKDYYATDLFIYVMDNSGKLVNVVGLKEAYPIGLDNVGLSWSDNNKLYEFNVNFTFREWYVDGYAATQFDSQRTASPGLTTTQVVPQRTESPRQQYSSATEGSTGGPQHPQIAVDVENARRGRESPPGAAGFPLQEGQSVTGNEGPIRSFSLNPLNWFR